MPLAARLPHSNGKGMTMSAYKVTTDYPLIQKSYADYFQTQDEAKRYVKTVEYIGMGKNVRLYIWVEGVAEWHLMSESNLTDWQNSPLTHSYP